VKIIDRFKAYFQKKEDDQSSTDHPLDGAADPAPAQPDDATLEQDRDGKEPAASTTDETPEPEPVIESATEPATAPVTEPAAEPVIESATPATVPVTESATEPAAVPVVEPAPATEPVTAATAVGVCPRCGATGDAPCTTPAGKPTKTHKGR
jgi:hypothetical protein